MYLLRSTESLVSEIESLFEKSDALRIKTENAIKEGQQMIEASSKSIQRSVDLIGENQLCVV